MSITSPSPRASVHLWHARLGHPNYRTVTSLSRLGYISCSNKWVNIDSEICFGCKLGKSHCLPFSLNDGRCAMPFDCLHYDLWGSSPVLSFTGYRYYAVFIDDYTRFSWIFLLKQKYDFFFIPSIYNVILRLNFHPKSNPFNVTVEPNLQIINFNLTCNIVTLFSFWHALTLLVKMAFPNASIAMSQKRVLPLCSMHLCCSLCGLRPSQLLSFSLTDSRHRYLMAKLLMSSFLVSNQITLCFSLLGVFASLI